MEADRVSRRMCDIHFYAMYGVYAMYMLFEDVCKQLLGIDDTSPTFQGLVRGFDNKIFQGDVWLWRLSQRAQELGLSGLFQGTPTVELPSKLKEQDAGKKWLEELAEYVDEFGWKNKQGWHYASPAWREDLSLPIEKVQGYIKTPEFNLADTRKALAEERERTAKEVISRVPEDQREWFSLLLAGAQHAGSFSEGHNFYCEGFNDAVMRRILVGIGRRFAAAGAFDHPDDIFLLAPEDLQKVGAYPERYNLRPMVSSRRAAWGEHLKPDYQFPPVISKNLSPEEAFGWMVSAHDPIFEKVIIGAFPTPRPELKADVLGIPGSPGVAEGVARILFSPEELLQVQPGEILVCPSTDPNWTPVFALLKGVVVDMGGSLCHAAIVSREYGIPCVLNTFAGTSKIKNGQRIRVDGDVGAVYVLEG
jgi:pyruvate,water dikinase